MLLVFGVVVGLVVAGAMFVHALRADKSPGAHGWLVAVPLLIVVCGLLAALVVG